ncbi:AMP-binding protein [Cyanobacterium aponinum]|uniref:O-succinylbenzoate--CoA ligase n=1 Tax=Cyanobacterium aponinum (strain PCC 10605) TaxID=755178 RepID=K9Z252_CYAAP|nr:AMP-binding protein [Cyanobacterium aponinum]AFZ52473.1 o-succinylbenzoate--CoA ligase [Cyanobacterium aponinum PCC 10605]
MFEQRLFEKYLSIINKFNQEENIIIFLGENDFCNFVSAFFACINSNVSLFLVNPNWGKQEWQQVEKIVTPDLIFGKINYKFSRNKQKKQTRLKGIMIPTGGTSGQIKFAIHTWETLTNSALSFYQFFGNLPINSFCCLPLYHVSGLMQVVRSFISEGDFVFNTFNYLKNNHQSIVNYQDYFISLVPTQLQFFLDKNPFFLQQFKTILVGGASISPQQINLARTYNLPLALTYGMTETASGITILKPEYFTNNNNSSGQVLPHANIISSEKTKDIDEVRQKGFLQYSTYQQNIIAIKATSLFKGYYPHYEEKEIYLTDDVGYFDQEGFLCILGRNSQKIITGGENVFPQEIEKAILNTNLVQDVVIKAEKDPYWGDAIASFYVPKNKGIKPEQIKAKLRGEISNYKIPKIWYCVTEIPRNSQGKVEINKLNRRC